MPSARSEQLRVIALEQRSHVLAAPIGRGMDFLNELVCFPGHDQQVSDWVRPGVPKRVWRAAPHQNSAAWPKLHVFVTIPDAQPALEHIPSFIVIAMQVYGSDPAWRIERASGVLPLGDDKVTARRPEHFSRKRWSHRALRHRAILIECIPLEKAFGSGPGDVVVPVQLAKVFGGHTRNPEILSEKSIERIEPEDLAIEHAAEVAGQGVGDIPYRSLAA